MSGPGVDDRGVEPLPVAGVTTAEFPVPDRWFRSLPWYVVPPVSVALATAATVVGVHVSLGPGRLAESPQVIAWLGLLVVLTPIVFVAWSVLAVWLASHRDRGYEALGGIAVLPLLAIVASLFLN